MANDDVNTPLVAIVGLIGGILIFVVVMLLTVFYQAGLTRQQYATDLSPPYPELENVLASQRTKLANYRWVDEKNSVVAIPIDRAMPLVVRQQRRDSQPSSPDDKRTQPAEP